MDGKKFVGGAALARRKAIRAKFNPPARPNKQTKKQKRKNGNSGQGLPQRLPNKVSPTDRFFASLLLSSIEDIVSASASASANNDKIWSRVMNDICARAGSPFPRKIKNMADDIYEFFGTRASLVLEEARCILAEELSKHERRMHQGQKSIHVRLLEMKQTRHGFTELIFSKKRFNGNWHNNSRSIIQNGNSDDLQPFSPSELYDMKPGCVMEVSFPDKNGRIRSILTNIVPKPSFGEVSVSLMAYGIEGDPSTGTGTVMLSECFNDMTDFRLAPVTCLISEQRQFAACFTRPNVDFLPRLMGMKSATHTRFEDSDSEISYIGLDDYGRGKAERAERAERREEKKIDGHGDGRGGGHDDYEDDHGEWDIDPNSQEVIPKSLLDIPQLNCSQEKAANAFINGPLQNLALVQGPPGTGKTTFMTAVLCRTFLKNYNINQSKEYHSIDRQKRVLVTAPTNKAISVLASRFLRATKGYIGLNVVLIGVEDSLFPTSEMSGGVQDHTFTSLKNIFVYSWVDELIRDFQTLKFDVNVVPTLRSIEESLNCAHYLIQKMERGIPQLSEKYGSLKYSKMVLPLLEDFQKAFAAEDGNGATRGALFSFVHEINDLVERIASSLSEMRSKDCPVSELLATANIIFSTLTSSGVSLMKKTRSVHELFIDEAAAATEPEILIPLHLRPRRMLAVGDPKQLPASVTSKRAADFGLDKSLLDRLMFGCGEEHTMLDIQYRMSPAISAFPSSMFYNGKLQNGDNVKCPNYKGNVSLLNNSEAYTFIQVNGRESRARSGSYYNMDEARAVVRLVELIRDASQSYENKSWASTEKLRIITFYSGQVMAIKDLLRSIGLGHIFVATVDSSQGCESDIVLVSFVRCEGNISSGIGDRRVGFLNDDRRINVAMTRAKFKLICVGDAKNKLLKSGVATLTSLVKDVVQRKLLSFESILDNR